MNVLVQMYVVPVDGAKAAVHQLPTCLVDVKAWLNSNRLRLNPAFLDIFI